MKEKKSYHQLWIIIIGKILISQVLIYSVIKMLIWNFCAIRLQLLQPNSFIQWNAYHKSVWFDNFWYVFEPVMNYLLHNFEWQFTIIHFSCYQVMLHCRQRTAAADLSEWNMLHKKFLQLNYHLQYKRVIGFTTDNIISYA